MEVPPEMRRQGRPKGTENKPTAKNVGRPRKVDRPTDLAETGSNGRCQRTDGKCTSDIPQLPGHLKVYYKIWNDC